MTIFALHSWSTMTVGYGKILSFVFLGKGFYYARYADLDTMYALVNMVENLSLMLILSLMHRLRLCVIVRFHMLKDLPVFFTPSCFPSCKCIGENFTYSKIYLLDHKHKYSCMYTMGYVKRK